MTDDPFLPKKSEHMSPVQPSAQPVPIDPSTLDPYSGPVPTDPTPYQAPPVAPAQYAPAQYEPYEQPGYTSAAPTAYPQAAPGYPPPPPMPYYPGQPKPKTWMNWVAFGCGLGGLVTCGLSGVVGIVFGHLGLSASKRGEADARGAGLAGLIISYVFVVAMVAYWALIIGVGLFADYE